MEHGHRKIAYICNPANVYTQVERLRGYREALAGTGKAAATPWERLIDDPAIDPVHVVSELLDIADPPTAIIAGNNRMCVGVLRALHGKDNPPALIGFDDFDTAIFSGYQWSATTPWKWAGAPGNSPWNASLIPPDHPAAGPAHAPDPARQW
ncbi:substrate-binding domain-containing protein [Glutamicibacter nicotianae]|uniref:substrate-binding domain-containing protein n=1 Tax=Glutamicibacter nicotianae TaxID=37929 RepID=UPI0031DCC927